jgi:hypothetical protein
MFTSAECEAYANEKLAGAESNPQHRRRLLTAAEAWLRLADKVKLAERLLPRRPERACSIAPARLSQRNGPARAAGGG